MSALTVAFVLAFALLVTTGLKLWLLARQMRHVALNRGAVPADFAASVPLSAHQKAADYTLAKGKLATFGLLFNAALLVGWTLLGGLDVLNQWVNSWVEPASWGGYARPLVLVGAFAFIGMLLDLPLELYNTFVLEERFGFNRTRWQLYVVDAIKGLAVGLVLGGPLLLAVLALMQSAGPQWWLWAWGLWIGFQLLVMVLYPVLIAPLFNKFEPLQDEGLVARVQALFQRAGFSAKGLFVMDGSRRSAHGNAYFTGLGAAKRVVFFDTLLKRLEPPEVEAVLAHELGHFKLKHVPKRLVGFAVISLLGFAALGWLAQQPAFYVGLGVQPSLISSNDALALLLFLMVVPVLAYPLGPLMAASSRKHEFEADAYACQQADGKALASALLKLHEDNASTLTPDPVYARWNYSHPPAVERLGAIRLQTS
ncbi:MAG: M48 family metallopeptidase [Burkholderiales bacterium]